MKKLIAILVAIGTAVGGIAVFLDHLAAIQKYACDHGIKVFCTKSTLGSDKVELVRYVHQTPFNSHALLRHLHGSAEDEDATRFRSEGFQKENGDWGFILSSQTTGAKALFRCADKTDPRKFRSTLNPESVCVPDQDRVVLGWIPQTQGRPADGTQNELFECLEAGSGDFFANLNSCSPHTLIAPLGFTLPE